MSKTQIALMVITALTANLAFAATNPALNGQAEQSAVEVGGYFDNSSETNASIPGLRPVAPTGIARGTKTASAIASVADYWMSVSDVKPRPERKTAQKEPKQETPRERTIREAKENDDFWGVIEYGSIWDALDYTKGALAFSALLGGAIGGLIGYGSVGSAAAVLKGVLFGGLLGAGVVVAALLIAKFVAFMSN